MTDELLRASEICAERKISLSTFLRLIASGHVPPGQLVGLRGRRWRRSVVDTAFETLNASRRSTKTNAASNLEIIRSDEVDQEQLEAAAQWLAGQQDPPRPVIGALRDRFGFSALEACQAAARAFELRSA